MQVLIPCLIFLAIENVQLVRNEHLDAQEVLDSTQFKNAVAKELLKKKLSTLESARQPDSLASFLRKGGKNLSGLRTATKSSFHKDDDPSRKQAQMANTFIASSNLLFGAKSQQRKAANSGSKQTNKEVLDMRSLRQTYSGYNEDGSDFSSSKDAPKIALDTLNDSTSSALKKRSYSKKAIQDPISCYLTEPKKVTCMHKDIIYKIALPSSEVADDEIGRIVESIYRAVEGKSNGKASLDEGAASQTSLEGSQEATDSKKPSSEDSLKKKRASDDYLRSLFLNNLLVANHKTLPNYNGNNPVFIPLLIPMAQPKLDPPKTQAGYYSGLAIDPRLQIPMNLSVGVDPVNNYQASRNVLFENGYGQYLVPDGFALPELNLKQRSQVNLTAEEEKRRNWLALMATNGLVPVENGVNPKVLTPHSANGELQSIADEKDLPGGNKLTVSQTGEALEKLLNKRHQRDTYFLRRQLRRKPVFEDKSALTPFGGDGRKQVLTRVVQKLSDPGGYLWEEKRGCPCPCPSDVCSSTKSTRKPTKCAPKYPARTNFQPTTDQPSNGEKCCASTIRCPPTCPEGCQPIQSTQSCKPCSKKSNEMCGDSDIISRVVSGGMNNSDRPHEKVRNSPPLLQASRQNWLPYSPQLIPQNQPQWQSRGSEHEEEKSQKYQENQQSYLESGNVIKIPYSATPNRTLPQYSQKWKDDQLETKFSEQYDHAGTYKQKQQYSQPFKQEDQPKFPMTQDPARNQSQVNYKMPPLGFGTSSDGSAQTVDDTAVHDVGFKMNESQSKPTLQADHNNTTSKQNDAKNKKHRDSFFARLRSKFHKGIPLNGTDQDNQYNHQNEHIQNKAILGASIFKFNPKNHTFGSGKNSTTTTCQPNDNRQYSEDQINQLNDQALNQTQPLTVNNINITISSMHPQPGAPGRMQKNNQSKQQEQPPKNCVLSPNRIQTTAQAASNSQNRTGKVTKIWLCSQRSPINMADSPNSMSPQPSTCQTNQSTTCTQPSTCQTNQTTTCQTTQSTTRTTTPTTCKTSPSTCKSIAPTSVCPSTQLSTCDDDSWSVNIERVYSTETSTCATDTPSTPTCGSDVPSGYPPPENPWSPRGYQTPPGVPPPPPDTSQGGPGAKMSTFNYGPYPVWNQWQQHMDRMNSHLPQQNLNWQQQTRVPLPSPYIPQLPHKPTEQYQKVPQPIPITQGPPQKQAEHPLPPQPPRRQMSSWRPNGAQPQMQGPTWQGPSRQFELDPRWQNVPPNVGPNFPNMGAPGSGQIRPTDTELNYRQGMNSSPYEENKWSQGNSTMVRDADWGTGKVNLPANIQHHIARVRRYLLKKRSRMLKQPKSL